MNVSTVVKRVVYLANGDTGHPLRDSAVDAAISAGAAFFGTLGGMSVVGIRLDPQAAVLAGLFASGLAFFTSLQAARKRSDHFNGRTKRRRG